MCETLTIWAGCPRKSTAPEGLGSGPCSLDLSNLNYCASVGTQHLADAQASSIPPTPRWSRGCRGHAPP